MTSKDNGVILRKKLTLVFKSIYKFIRVLLIYILQEVVYFHFINHHEFNRPC